MAAMIGCLLAAGARAEIRHNYLFNSGDGTQILDSGPGMVDGTVIDTLGDESAFVDVANSRLALTDEGYGDLPAADIAINEYTEVSLEMWLSQAPIPDGQVKWVWAAGFGRTSDGSNGETANFGYDYLMIMPSRDPGGEGTRAAISPGTAGDEIFVQDGDNDLDDGMLHHLVMTIDDTELAYYVDGMQIGTAALDGASLADVSTDFAYIGGSLYPDPDFVGSIFEYRIYDNALTSEEVTANFQAGCLDSCGEGPVLTINRETGEATFSNGLAATGLVRYSLTSEAGSLDLEGWAPIAENGDADSGGSVDPDDAWEIVTQTASELTEQDPIGGGGPDDGAVFGPDISIGNAWNPSPFEDVVAELVTFDGFEEDTFEVPVRFEGGEALALIDLNRDGDVNGTDYNIHKMNHLQTLEAETWIESQMLGDLDGDLDNDHDDFVIFKEEFIALNGAEAFAALGAPVPEPASGVVLVAALACLARGRLRKQPALR